jgi:hypothetical protein
MLDKKNRVFKLHIPKKYLTPFAFFFKGLDLFLKKFIRERKIKSGFFAKAKSIN